MVDKPMNNMKSLIGKYLHVMKDHQTVQHQGQVSATSGTGTDMILFVDLYSFLTGHYTETVILKPSDYLYAKDKPFIQFYASHEDWLAKGVQSAKRESRAR